MDSCSNQKSVKQSKIYFIFEIAFMIASHTLGILSTSFTWNDFPTILKEFPHILSTCWLLFLHCAVRLIPNHLNLDEVGGLWRPGHLMQHSITLLLGQIALIQPDTRHTLVIVLQFMLRKQCCQLPFPTLTCDNLSPSILPCSRAQTGFLPSRLADSNQRPFCNWLSLLTARLPAA